jgi:hypothetical protein
MTETSTETQETASQQQETTHAETASSWDDLFKGEDPAKVREALDNSRKWESRAKDNFEKAKQYDALEEAKKSEQQKLEERVAAAEKTAQDSARDAARLRVALEKGLTPSQARRLVGDTEEDLAKDADEMLADLKPGRPTGDVGQGARGTETAPDMNQQIRAALGRT